LLQNAFLNGGLLSADDVMTKGSSLVSIIRHICMYIYKTAVGNEKDLIKRRCKRAKGNIQYGKCTFACSIRD
jgi:hypothetical protein